MAGGVFFFSLGVRFIQVDLRNKDNTFISKIEINRWKDHESCLSNGRCAVVKCWRPNFHTASEQSIIRKIPEDRVNSLHDRKYFVPIFVLFVNFRTATS